MRRYRHIKALPVTPLEKKARIRWLMDHKGGGWCDWSSRTCESGEGGFCTKCGFWVKAEQLHGPIIQRSRILAFQAGYTGSTPVGATTPPSLLRLYQKPR